MKKYLRYLESGKDFNGHFWYNTVKATTIIHMPRGGKRLRQANLHPRATALAISTITLLPALLGLSSVLQIRTANCMRLATESRKKNLKRIECMDEVERKMGTDHVYGTIKMLHDYQEIKNQIIDWMASTNA